MQFSTLIATLALAAGMANAQACNICSIGVLGLSLTIPGACPPGTSCTNIISLSGTAGGVTIPITVGVWLYFSRCHVLKLLICFISDMRLNDYPRIDCCDAWLQRWMETVQVYVNEY